VRKRAFLRPVWSDLLFLHVGTLLAAGFLRGVGPVGVDERRKPDQQERQEDQKSGLKGDTAAPG
jgi:hypothetical protein